MISVFDVTLAHFVIVDGRALARKGTVRMGAIAAEQLSAALVSFRDVMPIQDFEADPEILISTKFSKWKVHSDLGKLILYDVQKPQNPGIVCDLETLLREVDERAAEGRRTLLKKAQLAHEPVMEQEPESPGAAEGRSKPPDKRLVLSLAVIAALMLMAVFFQARQAGTADMPATLDLVEDREEVLRLGKQVAGVYMTGNPSSQQGLVIQEDGSVKIIQFNGVAAPGYVLDV